MKDKALPLGDRVYKRHRLIISKWLRRQRLSRSEIVRRALEEYDQTHSKCAVQLGNDYAGRYICGKVGPHEHQF
jgi:hypothetical protein